MPSEPPAPAPQARPSTSSDPDGTARKKPRRDGSAAGRGHVPRDANVPRQPRVYRACESCRRKKIKCDGVEPVCGQCLGSINQCTWKPTADRAAHSRQYVQQLETRLHHMETLFQHVAPVMEALSASAGAGAPGVPPGIAAQQNGVLPGAGGVPIAVNQQVAAQAARQYMQNIAAAAAANSQALPALSGGAGAVFSAPAVVATAPPVPQLEDSSELDEEGTSEEDSAGSEGEDTAPDSSEEVARKFGQLQIDENGQWRWIGGASTMSLVESLRMLAKQPTYPSPPGERGGMDDLLFPPAIGLGKVRRVALPSSDQAEYPPRDLADALVEAYFAKFHHTLPVLDKITFLAKYKDHMDHWTYRDDAGFQSTIFGVFAIAARFVNDPRLGDSSSDGGLAMTFYDRAMILHFIGATKTQLAHVQCVVLLSSFLASWNLLAESWLLLGQGIRTAQDLGLHRAAPKSSLTPLEREMHKRIWWSVYMLDRLLAIALGRPLGIEDSDCDVEPPLPLDDEALRKHMDGTEPMGEPSTIMVGFIALTELAKIGGQMLRQVYAVNKAGFHLDAAASAALQESVDALDTQLSTWCDSLPPELRSKPQGEKQTFMAAVLCTSYYAILISLHRVFLPTSRRHGPQAQSPSVKKAVSASRNCIQLAKALRNIIFPSHHLAFFVQYLFSSAVILCLCIMRLMDEAQTKQSMSEVTQCIQCLQDLEASYPGAKKCRELLSRLFDVTKEYAARRAEKDKHAHHHLHRTGSMRKTRRQSNKTGSSSPSEWTGKRPTVTPPRELPGSSQALRMSPGQMPAVVQQPTPPSGYQTVGQNVMQGMGQAGNYNSTSLRPTSMSGPPMSAPNYNMQPPSYQSPPSSESSSSHKRTREESQIQDPAGSSYIPTFGPNNQPLRPMHMLPSPINVGQIPQVNVNIPQQPASAPPAQGAYAQLPPLPPNYLAQSAGGTINPGLTYGVPPGQQEWNSPVKRESPAPLQVTPSAPPNPGSYTPSPPNYQTSFNVGANGNMPSFDLEGLNLPPGDQDFLNNFGEGWSEWGGSDHMFDSNMSLDPGNYDFGFDPLFPLDAERPGSTNMNMQH